MEITISTILKKMERELQKAHEAKDEIAIREHLIVIKTLCGLVLEEKVINKQAQGISPAPFPKSSEVFEKVMDDEDSNSDSLFDF